MKRNAVVIVLLAIVAALVIGCGGGGGGNSYVVTGFVKDSNNSKPVVGAKVKIGTVETTTNSQGQFRFEMSTAPVVRIFSIDGRNATPSPGYFDFWCRANNKVQNAKCIELPLIPKGETSLGTIMLMNADNPPPFPPACPQ